MSALAEMVQCSRWPIKNDDELFLYNEAKCVLNCVEKMIFSQGKKTMMVLLFCN